MTVVWTEQATRDLEGIYDYIARDKPDAAQRTVERIFSTALGLAQTPLMGRARVSRGLRELVVPCLPYLIRYSIEGERVLLTAVRHGAMQDI